MDWLVVGLGNPGKEYDFTPHNMGFMVCDSLSSFFNFDFTFEKKFLGFFAFFYIDGQKVGVLKPVTYMNLSGDSVLKVVNFYRVNHSQLLVVHDDIDLPFGRIKIKKNSSSGGHRGIESIINALSSKDFIRVKVGVGRGNDPVNYVLSKLDKGKKPLVEKVINIARNAVISIMSEGLNKAMTEFNRLLEVNGSEGV